MKPSYDDEARYARPTYWREQLARYRKEHPSLSPDPVERVLIHLAAKETKEEQENR